MTNLVDVRVHRRSCALNASVRSAQGPAPACRELWLLELRDEEGRVGWGEAAPWPAHGSEDGAAVAASLASLAARLPRRAGSPFLAEDAPALGPSARWALDTALGDLHAQAAGRSLASFWAGREIHCRSISTSVLLGDAAPEEAARAVVAGHHTLKLKVGSDSLARDVARVAAIRAEVGRDVVLRLDANGAWQPQEALAALDALACFAPAFVEQPVAAADLAGLAAVSEKSPIPIALDESLVAAAAPAEILAIGAAVWVLKPAALGLSRFRVLAAEADRAGVEVIVSSLLDGDVSAGAALHLAAARPEPAPACGLDFRCTRELRAVGGFVALPEAAGLGWRP